MKKFISTMDGLPKVAKVILALPVLDIFWNIYRICRSSEKKNWLGVILGIFMIIPGSFIIWVIDLFTTISKGKVLWID